ncbi:hypothetical protein L209DRAFT_310168 [Thermothelomyces heterothallicus CBS 203.75]
MCKKSPRRFPLRTEKPPFTVASLVPGKLSAPGNASRECLGTSRNRSPSGGGAETERESCSFDVEGWLLQGSARAEKKHPSTRLVRTYPLISLSQFCGMFPYLKRHPGISLVPALFFRNHKRYFVKCEFQRLLKTPLQANDPILPSHLGRFLDAVIKG